MSKLRCSATVFAVMALALTAASVAAAGGNGAQTFTQIDKNVVQVMTDNANPCTGDLGTLTYNDIFHGTMLANGTSWFTGTLTGSLLSVPNDPAGPPYQCRTGRRLQSSPRSLGQTTAREVPPACATL